jgi:precorrin-3B C17-methyltransferase
MKKLKENTIYVIGMGPGSEDAMTIEASEILKECDVIVGYTVYLDLLSDELKKKELISTPMRQEEERCRIAFEEAKKGKKVAFISSGDAGIYGMASLMYETGVDYEGTDIEVIPGVTAASSGAALLGAPINHDFCVISLSDLLTPWEKIEKRLKAAAEGDFAIALYNPSSHKRKDYLKKACGILLTIKDKETCCGYVKNIGREGSSVKYCTLEELKDEEVDMVTTVFIGNSQSRMVDGKLITPRGYTGENR